MNIIKQNEDYSIMVCPKCLKGKMSFILAYKIDKDVILPIISDLENIEEVENAEEEKKSDNYENNSNDLYSKRKEILKCPLIENGIREKNEKPVFLKDVWFDNLCLCENCLKLYKELQLEKIYKINDENVFYFHFI